MNSAPTRWSGDKPHKASVFKLFPIRCQRQLTVNKWICRGRGRDQFWWHRFWIKLFLESWTLPSLAVISLILFDSMFYQLLIRYGTKFIRHKHPVCVSSILGMFSTLRVTMSTLGGYHEYIGEYHEYIGGISWVHQGISWVHRGDIMMYVGDIMNTLGDVQFIRVFNINWNSFVPHMHHDIPRCSEHPPVYSWYPDVLMVSPRCTEHTLYRV